jgi:hypothetical protein
MDDQSPQGTTPIIRALNSLKPGVKNARSRNDIHRKLAPRAYREDAGRKDQGRALLDGGSAPPMSDDDNPIVTNTMTPMIDKGEGTYRTPSEYVIRALTMQTCAPRRTEHTSMRLDYGGGMDTPPASTRGCFAR